MRRWVWLLSVPISFTVHTLALVAVVWLLGAVRGERVLFVDLNPSKPADAKREQPAVKPPANVSRMTPPLVSDEAASAHQGPAPETTREQPAAPAARSTAPMVPTTPPAESGAKPRSPDATAPERSERSRGDSLPLVENRGGLPSIITLAPPGVGDSGGSPTVAALGPAGAGGGSASGARSGGDAALVTGTGRSSGDGDYGPYRAALRRRIQEVLRYPSAARRRGLTGTVEIEIRVEPSGAVSDVAVVDSSSHRVLDEAALEAVRSLPPLPFPSWLEPRALRVRLPVVFELR